MEPSLDVPEHPVFSWRESLRDSDLGEVAKAARTSPSTIKLVGFVLSTYMDRSLYCYPAVPTIARGCSLDERTVQRAIKGLGLAGSLDVVKGGGKSNTSAYFGRIPVPAPGYGETPVETSESLVVVPETVVEVRRNPGAQPPEVVLEPGSESAIQGGASETISVERLIELDPALRSWLLNVGAHYAVSRRDFRQELAAAFSIRSDELVERLCTFALNGGPA